jgi:two-component system sensor histidine kinase PilS (NtrC family)
MRARLERYGLFRFASALALLAWAASLVLSARGAPEAGAYGIFTLASLMLVVVVGTFAWVRAYEVGTRFAYGQLAVDAALVAVVSKAIGAGEGFLALMYFPVIAGGAYVAGRTGAVLGAAFSCVALAVSMAPDLWPIAEETTADNFTRLVLHVLAFFLVAFLTGDLALVLERTGKELQAERLASELVLERVRAGVMQADAEDTIVAMNPAARLLVGDVIGRKLSFVFRGPLHHRAWEELRGSRRRWFCSQAPLPTNGRVVVVEDVTELMEMRLRTARDERLVAVGKVAASMAHEIRNPLASLTGSLQLMREDRPSRLADVALQEAERLARLVDEFLAAARPPTIKRIPCDVHAIVQDVAEAFSRDPRFQETTKVEATGEMTIAMVDADRLRQIVWNLVLNGAQAMPRGGTIQVEVGVEEADVIVHVRDEGEGIPPEEIDRIFDPFYTRRAGGTGLGLALVDQVVRAHGGYVDVRPREGGGTEFALRLPREEADAG